MIIKHTVQDAIEITVDLLFFFFVALVATMTMMWLGEITTTANHPGFVFYSPEITTLNVAIAATLSATWAMAASYFDKGHLIVLVLILLIWGWFVLPFLSILNFGLSVLLFTDLLKFLKSKKATPRRKFLTVMGFSTVIGYLSFVAIALNL